MANLISLIVRRKGEQITNGFNGPPIAGIIES